MEKKTYTEFYCAEGILYDPYEGKRVEDRLLASAAWLLIFNPHPDKPAKVSITYYFAEHDPVAAEPIVIGPEELRRIELHDPTRLPVNTQYAIRVISDVPVIPQHTMADYRPFELVPSDMETTMLYSGPLGDNETSWYFTDSWMGFFEARPWFERETLSILNPGDEPAKVSLTYYFGPGVGDGRQTVVTVPPRRVLPLRMWQVPEVAYVGMVNEKGQHFKLCNNYSVWLQSSIPVVAQKTRRAYRQYEPAVAGQWSSIGVPVGGQDGSFTGGGKK